MRKIETNFVSMKWLVLWSLWAARLVPQFTPVVKTSSGLLRGLVSPEGDVASYNGITYATVRRFQAPGPAPTWPGVFNAIDEHIKCHQTIADVVSIGQADCLILNVHTPLNTPPDANLPVMFFVHGGGYFSGSASPLIYGPKYLVNKGVILVTVNYRLNIQGFLCLRIKENPGNAANKDHVAALRWVRDNIRAFGGNPDSVTIFGESAGAASISYLVLSSMAKGLFHKAITQSGSSLSPWTYQFKPVYLASLLAKTMLHETHDPHELYKLFMSKSDSELILTRVPRQKGNIVISEILYTPCAEKAIDGEEPFLTESPYDILSKGTFNKVPMIVGSSSDEGLFIASLDNETMMRQIEFEKSLPKNLEIPSEEVRKEISGTLKKLYMGDTAHYDELKLSKLYGEQHLVAPALEEVELMMKSSDQPIYTYVFDYSGWRNIAKMHLRKPFNIPQNATHADELFYMFSQSLIPNMFETEMIDKITTLWTNFAKYGNPTPEPTKLLPKTWRPVQRDHPESLLIREEFSTVPLWFTESLRYLREVYAKYRRRR